MVDLDRVGGALDDRAAAAARRRRLARGATSGGDEGEEESSAEEPLHVRESYQVVSQCRQPMVPDTYRHTEGAPCGVDLAIADINRLQCSREVAMRLR